jgi:hypothetical protein
MDESTATVTKLPDGQIEISTLQRHLIFRFHDEFCGELGRLPLRQPGISELAFLVQEAVFHGSATGPVEDDLLAALQRLH